MLDYNEQGICQWPVIAGYAREITEIAPAITGYRRAESISLAMLVDASARTLRSGSLPKHRKGGDVARHMMTKIVGLLADDPGDL